MLLPGPVPGHGEQGESGDGCIPASKRAMSFTLAVCAWTFAGHQRNEHTRKEPDCSENLN